MSDQNKILLVDDDADILEQVRMMLDKEGYKVVTAQGRQEAEETLLSFHPDLAVVDLMMEEMDAGFVLTYQIKRLYPDTPVIILTAVTSATGMSFKPRTQEEKSWIKADSFMDKPVSREQLAAEVKRLLSA